VPAGWPSRRGELGGGLVAGAVPGLVVAADRGEPILGVAELTCDHVPDVGVKRSVRAKDELE
jgi:hypothetical protein